VFRSIIDFTPIIMSCRHVLDNDWIVNIAKTNLGKRHSFLPVFVVNHHVSVTFFAGLYLASYTSPSMTLLETHILCIIKHDEMTLLIFFRQCPRKVLAITWNRDCRTPNAPSIFFLADSCHAVHIVSLLVRGIWIPLTNLENGG
jgi:hypothetical protein